MTTSSAPPTKAAPARRPVTTVVPVGDTHNVSGPDALTSTSVAPLPEAIIGSLSPSRAADFKSCPLLYRFRTIDRIPEPPSRAAVRGTVVHAALESLFDLPAPQRTVQSARGLIAPSWAALTAENPELLDLFTPEQQAETPDLTPVDGALGPWLDSARELIGNYFRLEDPRGFDPKSREELVEVVLDGLRLRGYIDRLDEAPDGSIRVVDYKTGSTPREAFEAKALFQMKFYALVLWRTRGVVPRQLKLIYLADADTLSYSPEADELARFESTVKAIWAAIAKASITGDFRPNRSKLCNWCEHQALCPAFGGTPPPFPYEALARSQGDRRIENQPAPADPALSLEVVAGD